MFVSSESTHRRNAEHSWIVKTSDQVKDQLDFLQSKLDCCLVIDGDSLQVGGHTPARLERSLRISSSFASIISRMSLLRSLQSSLQLSLVDAPLPKKLMLHVSSDNIRKNAYVALVTGEMT